MLKQISHEQITAIEDFAQEVKKGFCISGNSVLVKQITDNSLDYIDGILKLYREFFDVCSKIEGRYFAKV